MAQNNIHVENVIHVEDHSNKEGPYAEIAAAVQRQLERNNQAMLRRMEDQAQQTINDAVKRALANQAGQGPSTKRQKKEPDFKSKDNQLRYEVTVIFPDVRSDNQSNRQ